jgi:hypothetical protein
MVTFPSTLLTIVMAGVRFVVSKRVFEWWPGSPAEAPAPMRR